MIAVADGFAALGYVELVDGFNDRITGKAKLPRMKPTPPLISLLQSEHAINPKTIIFPKPFTPASAIVLKDRAKQVIAFEETEFSKQLRHDITAYNELLWSSYIDAHLAYIEPDESYRFDLSRKSVYASFNNNSFEQGGRLYGAWWMSCQSRIRECIFINDEWTEEHDYSSFHPRLLYALAGKHLTTDPYDTSVLPAACAEHPDSRNLMKLLFMLMINCDNKQTARNALHDSLSQKSESLQARELFFTQFNDIIERYEQLHSPVADRLFQCIGLTLQNIDAAITMKIVNAMTQQHGIPILTIHDSYICSHRHSDVLLGYMHQFLDEKLSELGVSEYFAEPEGRVKPKRYVIRDFGGDTSDNIAELSLSLEDDIMSPYARRKQAWLTTNNPNYFYS